jgi:hypothetical protein
MRRRLMNKKKGKSLVKIPPSQIFNAKCQNPCIKVVIPVETGIQNSPSENREPYKKNGFLLSQE